MRRFSRLAPSCLSRALRGVTPRAAPADWPSPDPALAGFGYEHDEAWMASHDLFRHFTDVTRGVRRLGAASVDLCHVAEGIVDAYWEYRLKPWDMAAGALIVEEAGGRLTTMNGVPFSVFDRSILATNAGVYDAILEQTRPSVENLRRVRGPGLDGCCEGRLARGEPWGGRCEMATDHCCSQGQGGRLEPVVHPGGLRGPARSAIAARGHPGGWVWPYPGFSP